MSKLMTDAWRTSGARYNAARRLRRRAFFSTASLAFFSATTVGLAFMQMIVASSGDDLLNRYLTVLSGCLGVFILAISLIEWGARNNERAENLHRNAEALNGFSRRIGIEARTGQIDPSREAQLQNEYDAIKATCVENHDPIDDDLFLASQRAAPEFLVNGKQRVSNARYCFILALQSLWSVWYFGLCWILLAVVIIAAPWGGCHCSASSP
jgi:hypothetical protein